MPGTDLVLRLQSLLGIGAMVLLAWLLSVDRRAVRWRPVLWGIGLQLAFAVVVLSPALQGLFFTAVTGAVDRLLEFSGKGAEFVFQSVEPHRIEGPDGVARDYAGRISPPVKTFAFWVLPTIIFFSSLMSALYHLGVMQRLVAALAWVMQRTMGTSGAESLSAAANIFVGQTEAPLVVRPYVERMTDSELHAVMTGGFATVSGGVMAAYVAFLGDAVPGIAGHLVTASILSAPAALAVSKVVVPETGRPATAGRVEVEVERVDANVIEAVARGAADGMRLALNVAAMLVAFVALIAMADWFLGLVVVAGEPLSLARVLGWLFAPLAVAMGVPVAEAPAVGALLGEKMVLTEFIAYMDLGRVARSGALSPRSAVIASYALCGFANFASIGIQLGGIGGIAPSRTGDLARLGLRAMLAGTLAACMTATVAGVFLG